MPEEGEVLDINVPETTPESGQEVIDISESDLAPIIDISEEDLEKYGMETIDINLEDLDKPRNLAEEMTQAYNLQEGEKFIGLFAGQNPGGENPEVGTANYFIELSRTLSELEGSGQYEKIRVHPSVRLSDKQILPAQPYAVIGKKTE